MMRNIVFAAVLVLTMNIACAGKKDNGLVITVVPQQPVLIPVGTVTVGGTQYTAPVFIVNSVSLTWTGTNNLDVIAILMSNPANSTTAVNCGVAGDTLSAAYIAFKSNTGQVILPPNTTNAQSQPIACSGVTVPTPLPTQFNIPVQLQVIGIILDGNGNAAGRVQQTVNITVQ